MGVGRILYDGMIEKEMTRGLTNELQQGLHYKYKKKSRYEGILRFQSEIRDFQMNR